MEYLFYLKELRLKTQHSHPNLPGYKLILRKTNRMESEKWTYHKKRSFVGKYFFLKIQFQYKNFL